MATEKLYFENSYIKDIQAKVIKYQPFEDKFAAVLDRTVFYPESGGQPADEGTINGSPVLHVTEQEGEVLHILQSPPELGAAQCSIDWTRRFDHMQQHTGQHILSACFAKLYGGETDSFHIGRDTSSIEINIKAFDEAMAAEVEDMANSIVFANHPVKAAIVDAAILSTLPLRKQPSVRDNIRIVSIADIDYSPCGGTHVAYTGEVGTIKLRRWEKCKESYRFEFVCGYRALRDYRAKNLTVNNVGARLSVRDHEVESAFDKLLGDYRALLKQYASVRQELLGFEAAKLMESSHAIRDMQVVAAALKGKDINDLKTIAQSIVQNPSHVALLVAENETAQVVFSRSEDVAVDMGSLLRRTVPILEGKGGGSPKSAQGGGSRLEAIEAFLNAALKSINE